MYSAKVLEHLDNPRNVGELAGATVRGEAFNPVCGDRLILDLRLDETGGKAPGDEIIIAAGFLAEGCPPSIAAGSALTELLIGLTVDEARSLTPRQVTTALESLPRNKEHCSILAIDALRSALATRRR